MPVTTHTLQITSQKKTLADIQGIQGKYYFPGYQDHRTIPLL